MAKGLLWFFVIGNFIISCFLYINGEGRSYEAFWGAWIAIAVLAICESIEKLKKG